MNTIAIKFTTQKIPIDSATKWPLLILKSNGSQSVLPRPASSASLENLREMQIIEPHPALLNEKLWE